MPRMAPPPFGRDRVGSSPDAAPSPRSPVDAERDDVPGSAGAGREGGFSDRCMDLGRSSKARARFPTRALGGAWAEMAPSRPQDLLLPVWRAQVLRAPEPRTRGRSTGGRRRPRRGARRRESRARLRAGCPWKTARRMPVAAARSFGLDSPLAAAGSSDLSSELVQLGRLHSDHASVHTTMRARVSGPPRLPTKTRYR